MMVSPQSPSLSVKSSEHPASPTHDESPQGQENLSFTNEEPNVEFVAIPSEDNNMHVSFCKARSKVEIHQPDQPTSTSEESIDNEQSAYEEVAANVSNKDEPGMFVLTFRSWFLGIGFTCLLSFVNQFFWYRTSPLIIGVLVAQLLSHLLGKFMARFLPTRKWKIFRWTFTLNPGPFTVKEHCIITAMANAASGTAYAIDVITIQRLFYKRSVHAGIGIIFVVTSQILGYGMAGIMRKFLVWPAAMIWPSNLVSCALFRTLHNDNDDVDDHQAKNVKKSDEEEETTTATTTKPRWQMTRLRFFFLAFVCQFLYYWLPGYIFPVISLFSWICMIKPDNIILSQLTGIRGLGLGAIELDWNSWVSFLGSPIVVPFWAQINISIGFIALVWIITPAAYYSNLWDARVLPIVSNRVFTAEGHIYNVSAVLNSNLRLNETAYKDYGEIRMTPIFAFSYGISFAAIAAVIVHTILYQGKTIVKQFRSSLKDNHGDVHARLMSHYKEAPEWWYTSLFLGAFALAAIACHFGKLMPWYYLFVAVAIAFFFVLPTGIVAAVTNQAIGLNVITEFVAGVMMPGDPLANVTFKTYGYISQYQALLLISDLKLGHYMKIPPRAMFITQLAGTIMAGVINYLTANYLMDSIPNICTTENVHWSCPNANTFFSASIIWGAIGPVKMFGKGATYSALLYGFLIGAVLPIPAWLLMKKFPKITWLKYIHFPIMLSATAMIPPAPPGNYPSWVFVGFIFNVVLVRYAQRWRKRYAYIFSAAMDCGVAFGVLVIFFVLQNNKIDFPNWWGTGGPTGDGCPLSHANYYGAMPKHRPLNGQT